MGRTDTGTTYPYFTRPVEGQLEVFNTVTGEVYGQYDKYSSGAADKVNELLEAREARIAAAKAPANRESVAA